MLHEVGASSGNGLVTKGTVHRLERTQIFLVDIAVVVPREEPLRATGCRVSARRRQFGQFVFQREVPGEGALYFADGTLHGLDVPVVVLHSAHLPLAGTADIVSGMFFVLRMTDSFASIDVARHRR